MKRIAVLTVIVLALTVTSCRDDKSEEFPENSQVEFTFGFGSLKSIDTLALSGVSSVIITVENNSGKVVLNSEKIDLYNMNGSFITKPVALVRGSYKVTRFLVLNGNNNVVYASPITGSAIAYLVQKPLPVNFEVTKDKVTKVTLEVLNSSLYSPESFGYGSFDFKVAQTFDFLLGVFVYDDVIKNFILTDANIEITGDSNSVVYNGSILKLSGNSSVNYDSLGITSKITLPERYNLYTLAISKSGYKTYRQTFTKEELKLHFRSIDKGPLVVVLEKSSLEEGLIAYYKFNGDLLDYSGNNNHGTYFGRGLYTSGRKGDINGAADLDGSDDYIVSPNSPSLNPGKITVSAWVKPTRYYVGGGNEVIIEKANTVHAAPYYQYHMGMSGSYNIKQPYTFGFSMGINNTYIGVNSSFKTPNTWEPDKWYHVVGSYDGKMIRLYINKIRVDSVAIEGSIDAYNTELYIGKFRNASLFTPVVIDEIRIYNRALSIDEIETLYQK